MVVTEEGFSKNRDSNQNKQAEIGLQYLILLPVD